MTRTPIQKLALFMLAVIRGDAFMKRLDKILVVGFASVLTVSTIITSMTVIENLQITGTGIEVGVSETAMLRDGTEIPDGVTYFDMDAIDKIALAGAIPDDDPALRSQVEQAIDEVNEIRVANGLNALAESFELRSCSDVRAYECYKKFSHTRPNGNEWFTVNSDIMWGENLAYGFNNSGSVVNAWMNSPTHAYNILYPEFNTISISVYVDKNGIYYWSQEFGK